MYGKHYVWEALSWFSMLSKEMPWSQEVGLYDSETWGRYLHEILKSKEK